MNKEIKIFENIDEISDFVKNIWLGGAQKKGKFTIAISGGKTPLTVYQAIAKNRDLPWGCINIFLVDERFVSLDDEESNYRMIKENLLDKVDIPEKNIHSIYIEEPIELSAKRYEEELIKFFNLEENELPQFDLIMLGIGEDGHMASLFPNSKALFEKQRNVASVKINGLKNKRITITLPVINNASNVIFLVTGKNKTDVVKRVVQDKDISLPASMVRPVKGKLFFVLDKDAGSLLRGGIQ